MKHYRVVKDYDGHYVPQSMFTLSEENKSVYISDEWVRKPYIRDDHITYFEDKALAISYLNAVKERDQEQIKRDRYNKDPEVVYEI